MFKVILLLKWKSLKTQLQYPVNFTVHILGFCLMDFVELVTIFVLTNTFHSIGGWGFWELGFMFSIWQLGHGLHNAFFSAFWGHGRLVRSGDFDRLLIGPLHPILQIMARDLHLSAVGELLPGIIVFCITCTHVKIVWGLLSIAFLALIVISGMIIEWTFFLTRAAFDFWFVEASSLAGVTDFFLFMTTRYPAHVYGQIFLFLLTFVFPSAFMAYYPTLYFFQITPPLPIPFITYASPLVAVISLIFALTFWHMGLRHYESSGT